MDWEEEYYMNLIVINKIKKKTLLNNHPAKTTKAKFWQSREKSSTHSRKVLGRNMINLCNSHEFQRFFFNSRN